MFVFITIYIFTNVENFSQYHNPFWHIPENMRDTFFFAIAYNHAA